MVTFDTLKFYKEMSNAGMEEKQAITISKELQEIFSQNSDHLATKSDIREVKMELKGEIYLGSESGKIYRLTSDGTLDVVAQSAAGGILLGLSIRSNGHLLVCDAAAKIVWEVNLESQTWEVFCNSAGGIALNLPNWGCFLPDGSYVFSDSGDHPEATKLRI